MKYKPGDIVKVVHPSHYDYEKEVEVVQYDVRLDRVTIDNKNLSLHKHVRHSNVPASWVTLALINKPNITWSSSVPNLFELDNAWLNEHLGEVIPSMSKECTHNWKQYIGLMERYEYCTVCDAKKDNK